MFLIRIKSSLKDKAAAGLVGVVVGTASSAAVVALSNKETREKVMRQLNVLRVQGARTYQDLKNELVKNIDVLRANILRRKEEFGKEFKERRRGSKSSEAAK